ncbi:MAG: hypothetical protein AAB354_09585 [candidate division KSB1 bacterium]
MPAKSCASAIAPTPINISRLFADKEPAGYIAWLKQQAPETAFEAANPNKFDTLAARGQKKFEREGGTGYYKVPSLRHVWARVPLEPIGSVATLEDWFEPERTENDCVPTGFRGHGVKIRAVEGHPFGLALSDEDRQALIAFLKTL